MHNNNNSTLDNPPTYEEATATSNNDTVIFTNEIRAVLTRPLANHTEAILTLPEYVPTACNDEDAQPNVTPFNGNALPNTTPSATCTGDTLSTSQTITIPIRTEIKRPTPRWGYVIAGVLSVIIGLVILVGIIVTFVWLAQRNTDETVYADDITEETTMQYEYIIR